MLRDIGPFPNAQIHAVVAVVAISENGGKIAVIVGNRVLIDASREGVPGNGKPFPDGASLVQGRGLRFHGVRKEARIGWRDLPPGGSRSNDLDGFQVVNPLDRFDLGSRMPVINNAEGPLGLQNKRLRLLGGATYRPVHCSGRGRPRRCCPRWPLRPARSRIGIFTPHVRVRETISPIATAVGYGSTRGVWNGMARSAGA